MKTKLFILITILMINLNCQNTNFKSRGNWISVYSLLDKSSQIEKFEEEFYEDTIQLIKILSFKEDSFVLRNFNETFYYGFDKYTFKSDSDKDSLRFKYKEEGIAIDYFYDDEFLIIDFHGNKRIKYRDYFIQIDEYRMSSKEKEVSSFLTNNPVIIGQRKDKIELSPPNWEYMAEFIQDSLEVNYGNGNDWYFCSIEKELFLIIGDYLIHISEFDNEKVYGFTYNMKTSKIEIKKSKYSKKFDHKFLIGNWVEDKKYKGREKKGERKEFKIADGKIIVNSQNYSDTLGWSINKYRNKILIEKDDYERHGKYWKIEKLSKKELVIKRKIKENRESQIEILTFKKE